MATSDTANFGTVFRNSVSLGGSLGVASFVVNYVAILVFLILDGIPGIDAPIWKQTAWFFFNAHNVAIQDAQGSYNFLSNPDLVPSLTSTVPGIVYYALPVVVLVAAGYYMYDAMGVELSNGSILSLGATVAIGYGIPCLLFAASASATISGVSVNIGVPTALLIAGILYPLIFGTVGAVLARETQ